MRKDFTIRRAGWRLGRVACSSVLMLACVAASAGKPEWAGHGKNKGQDDERGAYVSAPAAAPGVGVEIRIGNYFAPVQRTQVQDYYRQQGRAGHCPPGLAKKNNGCMPPGQAKKWAMGRPLPYGVDYAAVDPRVLRQLGAPPAGHKFVQVAADILLIAVGTGMVVDAIEDLGR